MTHLICIHWSPELGLWTVHNPPRKWIVTPDDVAPGGRYAQLASVFAQAREAVESGRAVMGICVSV